jgi:acetylornithine deacetylase/succinyl-diaminopimelate desuccinylase-like protein
MTEGTPGRRRRARARRRERGRGRKRFLAGAVLGVGLGLAPGAFGAQKGPEVPTAAVHDWVGAHQHALVDELVELLELPNVAADQPDIQRNVARIRQMMARRGIRTRRLETGPDSSPVIYGELPAPGARATVLIYAHYDGQPVDRAQWVGGGPFDPLLRAGPLEQASPVLPWPPADQAYDPEWRVFARSASDDKAPIVAMLAALDALQAAGSRPAASLKFVLEGEEEAGSPHLEETLERNAGLLQADVAIVADGPVYPSNAPTVSFGARGVVSVQLTAYGPAHPLHSGHYGNWAPNPAQRLATLLAAMKDASGRVAIPGWYDDVLPADPEDEAALAALDAMPENEAERKELLVAAPEGGGRSRWAMVMLPSLNIDGLSSGWVDGAARTIIPDRATANLDLRLVPQIDPAGQVRRLVAFIEKQGWTVTREEPDAATRLAHDRLLRVQADRGYPAVRTPLDDPSARALITALRTVAGEDLVVIPTMGGSVPGYLFPRYTGATFVGLPIVNPDNNQHSPNENLRLGNLFRGVELFAAAMRMEVPPRRPARDGGQSR